MYGTTVPIDKATRAVTIQLPAGVAAQWPVGVEGVTIGGLNVGIHRGVELSCNTSKTKSHLECQVAEKREGW